MTDERITNNINGDEADKTEPAAPVALENKVGIDEYIGIAIKSIAVALSIIVLLTSILSVALPLVAMRTYNSLGMYERALASGTRYIERELKSAGLNESDIGRRQYLIDSGEVANAAAAEKRAAIPQNLNNDDFIEALDVCINLSDKLMRRSAEQGDGKSAAYFAEYLERYTRYFLSIDGVHTVLAEKDAAAQSAFAISYHPYIYSYKHTLMTLNFRARYYMGEMDDILFDRGFLGDWVTTLSESSNTFGPGSVDNDETVGAAQINRFIDYVDQISEYLSLELAKAGVDEMLNELPEIQEKYRGKLNGSEFSLFLTKADGYTRLYQNLKSLPKYAQAAVDFDPNNREEQLMQLYWLHKLDVLATRCWNMEILIWINRESYGLRVEDILDEYGSFAYRQFDLVNIPKKDGNGKVVKDENGKVVHVPQTDENGEAVKDENGNVVLVLSSVAIEYDKLMEKYKNIG